MKKPPEKGLDLILSEEDYKRFCDYLKRHLDMYEEFEEFSKHQKLTVNVSVGEYQ